MALPRSSAANKRPPPPTTTKAAYPVLAVATVALAVASPTAAAAHHYQSRFQKRRQWKWFAFLTVVCLGHYCFWIPRLSPTVQRFLDYAASDTNNTTLPSSSWTMDLPTLNTQERALLPSQSQPQQSTTSTTTSSKNTNVGMITCLANPNDRQAVLDVLVLAQNIQQQQQQQKALLEDDEEPEEFVLEIFHPKGSWSRFLQGYLETTYPFVTVVDYNDVDDFNDSSCLAQALQKTHLQHVLIIPPSIQFLQNPQTLLKELKDHQIKHCQVTGEGKMVSSMMMMTSHEQHVTTAQHPDKVCSVPLPRLQQEPPISIQHQKHTQLNNNNNNQALTVATIEGTVFSSWSWIQLSETYRQWVSFNDFHRESFLYSSSDIHNQTISQIDTTLRQHWKYQKEARRILLLDQRGPTLEWVAFDAGFHADDSATLNTLRAANRSLHLGTRILNLDIALTSDHQLVGVHNDRSITPVENLPPDNSNNNNKVFHSIAQLTAQEAIQLTSPCIPQDIVHDSLLPSPYQLYKCQPEPVALLSDFIDMIQTHDNNIKNNNKLRKRRNQETRKPTTTEIILDLKAPKVALQVEQARILAQTVAPTLQTRQLAVRFFSVFGKEDRLAATVFPEEALEALRTDPSLQGISYYVNVPSSVACLQLAGWIHNHTSFANKWIQGCFIIMDHKNITKSWNEFTVKHQINTTAVPVTNNSNNDALFPSPKMICDVPRKQSFRDPSLWSKEYNHCLLEGYDYIHDPFPFPTPSSSLKTQMKRPPSSLPPIIIPKYPKKVRQVTRKYLHRLYRKRKGNRKQPASMFGFYGSHADWSNEQFQWYQGPQPIEKTNEATHLRGKLEHNFRCVTKALTVMLFLKFQELGVLSIDDLVVDGSNHTYPMTYRQIFSNTGGLNGIGMGENFTYANYAWAPIPSAFERQTGLRFADAARHFIIEPMGLQGSYDEKNQTMPPYAGRGYNGEPEDLLVIGGTLASGGVSPKTQKQILSPASVEMMLANSINTPKLIESFPKDKIVRDQNRAYNTTGDFPTGFVHGYGLGLWRVNGWRHTAQGLPIQGWLSQGTCFVYFDTTGLVFSFFPKGLFTHQQVRAYVKMIQDIGNYTLEQLPGTATAPSLVADNIEAITAN